MRSPLNTASPLVCTLLHFSHAHEARLLQRLVMNLRKRYIIESEILKACGLKRAAELLIEAENIVRRETSLAELMEASRPVVPHE